jgi:hypothetical protein
MVNSSQFYWASICGSGDVVNLVSVVPEPVVSDTVNTMASLLIELNIWIIFPTKVYQERWPLLVHPLMM